MFYRIKQFWWGFVSLYKKIDYEFLKKYLNEEELLLFNKLKINDKHHSIRVCKDAIQFNNSLECNEKLDEIKLGKAALLHDIGKSILHLSLIDKSVIVILNKISKGKIKKYKKNKKVNIYYNHPEEGYKILNERGYSKDILEVIRYHHKKEKNSKNEFLKIVSYCDDRN